MQNHIHPIIKQLYRKNTAVPDDTPKVQGYDFNQGVDHRALLQSYLTTGFQATNFGRAIQEINKMIKKRQEPVKAGNEIVEEDPSTCPCLRSCTIFLGYTSNLISCGVRESIRYIVEHRMVDVLVTTAGGIEEDLIRCLGPVYMGDFTLPGKVLYKNGINRIGNILMPEDNYTIFDQWLMPILKQMLLEQNTQGIHWTPSKMIHRLGKEINNPESVCYWAYKRAGADYAVYVNTAQEFDGCDSGAQPDEAVSWGKITGDAKPVKVCGDATLIFPLLVAETFAVHAKTTAGVKKE
ncbi:hypothetical protein PAMP_009305 [Pampus punctatissimus]